MAMGDVTTYATVPAGTKFEFEDPTEPDNWLELSNIDSIGEIGQTGNFVEVTTLADKSKKYIADRPDAPDKELVFIDNADDPDFKTFLDAAEEGASLKVKIKLSNGRVATTNSLTLAGWKLQDINQSDNGAMKVVVMAKQNDISWGFK